jgi:hypothetical protein
MEDGVGLGVGRDGLGDGSGPRDWLAEDRIGGRFEANGSSEEGLDMVVWGSVDGADGAA